MKTVRLKAKRGPREQRERKTLTTETTPALEEFRQFSTFLYGEKKIGKTALCAQFEDATFVFTEPGYRGLNVRKNVADDWQDIRDFTEQFEEDDKKKTPEHSTVILDTADYAYDMCFTFMCKKLRISHPQDENDFGKSWGAIRKEFESVVKRLLALKKGVIFTSHAAVREFKHRDGESHSKLMPTLSGQAAEVIAGLFDNIFYFGFDGSDRVLVINGDEYVDAGTRIDAHFRTSKKKRRLNVVPMGSSPEEAHHNLIAAFNNESTEIGEVPTIAQKPKKRQR